MRFTVTCGALSHVTIWQVSVIFFAVNILANISLSYKNPGCYMQNNKLSQPSQSSSQPCLSVDSGLNPIGLAFKPAGSGLKPIAYAVTLVVSALSASPSVLAQSDSDHSAKSLDQVVVTATRTGELQGGLPMSIGVVDQQQLETDQGVHIQDSTRSVAGATINQLTSSSSHNTGIRMPLNYDGYYLFLQDSIPLQSSAFFNHNGLRWASYNTSADQIEILKGAGSTLHGSGAVAATVNVISAEPAFDPAGQVTLHAGEHGYLQGKVQHTTTLNDEQAILVAASALKEDGWREHTARERQEVLVKHLWQLNETDELKTQFQASTLKDEMASSLSESAYESDKTQSGLTDQVLATDPERTSDFVRLSVEWVKGLGDQAELSVIPYYRHNTNDYTATWRSYTPYGESSVDTFGVLTKGRIWHDNGSETVIGLDLEHSESDNLSYQPIDVTVTSFRGTVTDYVKGFKYRDSITTYQNVSPYIQHNMPLTEALMLSAGARYDISRYELDNRLAPTDNDGYGNRQLADRSDDFTSFNPKLGLNYKLNEASSFYGRIAQANRLPTASQLYNLKSGDSSSLVGGLKEESSTTYEVGYRYLTEDLGVTVSVYRMDIDDAIVVAYDDNDDSYRTNAGEVRHQGIELELGYDFSSQLSMDLALSKSEHEYIRYVNSGTDYSGNEQKLGPDLKGSATVNFIPVAQGPEFQLQMDHFGKYWMDDDNTRKADAYTVFHLKAQYQVQPQLKLFARIDNLTDKAYASQAEIRYGRSRFYPGMPRTFKAGLQYRW